MSLVDGTAWENEYGTAFVPYGDKIKMETNLLAVYGILKRGHCADLQERGCTFLGEGLVRGSLYRIGGGVGLLLPKNGDTTPGDAHVEVFEIREDLWRWLDAIENHPHTYERKVVSVRLPESNTELRAWIYEHQHPKYFDHRIVTGNYTGTGADLAQ